MTDKMNKLSKAVAVVELGSKLGLWLIMISLVPFIVYAKHQSLYLLLSAVILLVVGLTLRVIKSLTVGDLKSKVNTERWKENNQISRYE